MIIEHQCARTLLKIKNIKITACLKYKYKIMPSSHEQEGTLSFEAETQHQLEALELSAHIESFNGTCHEVSIFVQTDKDDVSNGYECRVYQKNELHLRNRNVVNMH